MRIHSVYFVRPNIPTPRSLQRQGGTHFMTRILKYLIVLFVIFLTNEPGFGEPGPLMSAGAGKSPADGPSSANVAAAGEKGVVVPPNKDPNVPSQIMEKLSNAVSSEYII